MPTRSLSAVSNHTGDSAKEEIKDKREWPPRSISATPNITGDDAKEAMRKEWSPRAVAATGDFTQEWPPKKLSTEKLISPDSTPPNKSPLSRTSSQSIPLVEETLEPEPEPVQPEPKPVPKRQPTIDPPVPAKVPAPKPVTKVAKTTTKPPAKAAPPSSFAKTPSLKPDRTLGPTASTSGRQSRPTSRATVRSKTPSAAPPLPQPKTPSKARATSAPRTPVIPRPTPVATPKTPSTGLYAPTAASLARSRNAPIPQPERKKTLSSSVSMDRLSKPTAASLSKARKPAVVSSHPPPQRKAAAPAKPRVSAPERMKPSVSKGTEAADNVGLGAAVGALLEAEQTANLDHTNGHTISTDGEHDFDSEMLSDSIVASHPDIVLSDVEGHDHGEDEILSLDEGSQQDEVVEEPVEEEANGSVASESVEHEEVVEPTQEEFVATTSARSIDAASNLHHADDQGTQDQSPVPVAESPAKPEDDIEDIVNLLESTSFSSKAVLDKDIHAHSTKPTALLDQAEEIPDEQ